MFAYCGNNPVCREDQAGCLFSTIITIGIGSIASVATSAISSILNNEDFTIGDAVGAAIEGAAATAMTMIGLPIVIANPLATFSGAVIGKIVDSDTSAEATKEVISDTAKSLFWSSTFEGAGKIAAKYVAGNYAKLGTIGKAVKEIVYKPKFLNTDGIDTAISENFWDGVQSIIANALF